MTPETQEKREQLAHYIQKKLAQIGAVQGVVGIGSLAKGTCRPDSDIDAVVFLDPLDLYIVPAEATWRESDDTFHSIFSDVEGLQLDFKRVDWSKWQDALDEPLLAELGNGWFAFDRHGDVERSIKIRATYDDEIRIARLDEALIGMEQHLLGDVPQTRWDSLGTVRAHGRLLSAYKWLIQALFAINHKWHVWHDREMTAVLQFDWLPDNFEDRILAANTMASPSYDDYMKRVDVLRGLFDDVLDKLKADGLYGEDVLDEAFIRSHEEPGRAWNIKEWQNEHRNRWG